MQGIAKATQRHVHDLAMTVRHQQFPDYSDRMVDEPVLVAGTAPAPADATWNKASADTAIRLALLDGSPEALAKILRDYPGHQRIVDVLNLLEARDDDASFASAQNVDTIEAFAAYLRDRPKGRHVAAAETTLKLLNAPASLGDLHLAGFERHNNPTDVFSSLAFSPDGRTLAAGSWDGTAKLWDVGSGRLSRVLDWRKNVPPGKREASGYSDYAAKHVWDLAYLPDGKLFLALEYRVNLWDPQSDRLLDTFFEDGRPRGGADDARFVAASPDGRFLASGAWSDLHLWDGESGRHLGTYNHGLSTASHTAFSPDGRFLGARFSSELKILDLETKKFLPHTFKEKEYDAVNAWAFSADSRSVVLFDDSNTKTQLMTWDLASGKLVGRSSHTIPGDVDDLVLSPDGQRGLMAIKRVDERTNSAHMHAEVLDFRTGERVYQLKGHANEISALAWSPDGQVIATASADIEQNKAVGDGIRLWRASDGRLLAHIRGLPNGEWVAFGEGGYVASENAHRYLRVLRDGIASPLDERFQRTWLKKGLTELANVTAQK